ncbi:hypothetical protein [Bacillus cereus]|uniref:hypothetical protein n=1 Tax=Bacillus cereus TaxID=1396 RepID=UPI001596A63B|nr:hypothetical protein [Bacillus cereus]
MLAKVQSAPAAVPVAAVLTNRLPAIKGLTIGIYIHPFLRINLDKFFESFVLYRILCCASTKRYGLYTSK